MTDTTPDAILVSEITVQRAHLAFLNTAFRHAGFEVDADFEGITTDEGVDSEIKMRVKLAVPIDVLAQAEEPQFQGALTRAIADRLKLCA